LKKHNEKQRIVVGSKMTVDPDKAASMGRPHLSPKGLVRARAMVKQLAHDSADEEFLLDVLGIDENSQVNEPPKRLTPSFQHEFN
jgi:hypothetical protein